MCLNAQGSAMQRGKSRLTEMATSWNPIQCSHALSRPWLFHVQTRKFNDGSDLGHDRLDGGRPLPRDPELVGVEVWTFSSQSSSCTTVLTV